MSIKNTLKEAKLKQELVSVYTDPDDWTSFSLGYVDLITDDHIRLRSVSKKGASAGYEIRSFSEISKIEIGGKYEKKISVLVKNQGKIFNEIKPQKSPSGDLILDSLRQSLEESVILVVWGGDPNECLAGYVEKLESNMVSLRLVDDFGEEDGIATISIEDITSLDFNTSEAQMRKFLHDERK